MRIFKNNKIANRIRLHRKCKYPVYLIGETAEGWHAYLGMGGVYFIDPATGEFKGTLH